MNAAGGSGISKISSGAALACTAAARHGGITSEALGTGTVAATAGGIALGATGWAGGAGVAGSLGGAVRGFLVLGTGSGLGEALGERGPAEDSSSLEVLSGDEVRWAAPGSAATGRSACTAVLGTAMHLCQWSALNIFGHQMPLRQTSLGRMLAPTCTTCAQEDGTEMSLAAGALADMAGIHAWKCRSSGTG